MAKTPEKISGRIFPKKRSSWFVGFLGISYICIMENKEFKDVLYRLSQGLLTVEYTDGDISDVGNEVGFILGQILPNMSNEEITDFIHGFRHGVSLTNGTH